jgi:hypothetical protein
MDILKLLEKDHDEVKDMLSKLSKKRDEDILTKLENEIYAHSEAEEECLYAPLRKKVKPLKAAIDAAHSEHDGVMDMLEKIHKIKNDKQWMQMFTMIKKSLEAHIKMEEEDIFSLSKECFTSAELIEMGKEFKKQKEEYLKEC